jgi:phosphatidate cytidylyltransferase
VLAFFVVLPMQFCAGDRRRASIWSPCSSRCTCFSPFLWSSALANDPQRFLERNAKLQWGIMVCVYGMSHVPALLLLKLSQLRGQECAFLVFFLVFVVQTCGDGAAPGLAAALQRAPFAPNVSKQLQLDQLVHRPWWQSLVGGAVGGPHAVQVHGAGCWRWPSSPASRARWGTW